VTTPSGMIGLTPLPASSCAAGAGFLFVAVFTAAGTAEPAAALGFKVAGAVEGTEIVAACEVTVAFAVPTAEAVVFVLEKRSPPEEAWAVTVAFAVVDAFVFVFAEAVTADAVAAAVAVEVRSPFAAATAAAFARESAAAEDAADAFAVEVVDAFVDAVVVAAACVAAVAFVVPTADAAAFVLEE